MVVRDGMLALIDNLRKMSLASIDNTDTDNYFTNEELQSILDRTSRYHVRTVLAPIREVLPGNTAVYTRYQWSADIGEWIEHPLPDFIDNTFKLQDSTGSQIFYGTAENEFTVEPSRRTVVFGSNREGKIFYLSVYSYDLNAAAAEVWLQKAGRRQDYVNWKTDNHTIAEDTEYQHCMEQYRLYSSRAKSKKSGRWRRVDQQNGWY